MAQKLFKNSPLFHSNNLCTAKSQILRPIIIQLKKSCSTKSIYEKEYNIEEKKVGVETSVKETQQTVIKSRPDMQTSYGSAGKLLRDFLDTIETIIHENISELKGHPIQVRFYDYKKFSEGYGYEERFEKFSSSGKYIIFTFGKEIEKYLKAHFPSLKVSTWSGGFTGIEIRDYLNQDDVLKEIEIPVAPPSFEEARKLAGEYYSPLSKPYIK